MLKADALILTILAMESASVTALPLPMLIPTAECANHAQLTASLALLTLSVMPAMLDTTSPMVSASLQLLPVHPVSTGTTEFATLPALWEAALKETSVKEFALPAHGHTTTVATELAQLSILLMMLVLIPAQLELPFKMEFAKLDLNLAPQDNTMMPLKLAVLPVNILALNVRSLHHTAQLVLLAFPSVKTSVFPPVHLVEVDFTRT